MTGNAVGAGEKGGVVPLVALPGEGASIDPEDASAVATLFKALADPIRVQLVALVRQAPDGEACFCDLADKFDMPQSSLSHHLKILVQAGILERERRGTWSWYRPSREPWEVMENVMRPGGPLRDGTKPRKRRSRPSDC